MNLIGWLAIYSSLSCIFSGALIFSFTWAFFFFFLAWPTCYVVRCRALGILQGGATQVTVLWCCMWGRDPKGNMPLAHLLASFQSFPLLPTRKLGPPTADSLVSGFVYILRTRGSLQVTLLWGWEFLPLLQPPQIFTNRGFEAFFSYAGTLGCRDCLAPHLFLPVYLHANVRIPSLPATTSPAGSSSRHPTRCPLCPSCPSPHLLPVWMNVSSITPWVSGFHTLQFSGSSGYFLVLNLLSFFWFWKCIHLHTPPSWPEVLIYVFFRIHYYNNSVLTIIKYLNVQFSFS